MTDWRKQKEKNSVDRGKKSALSIIIGEDTSKFSNDWYDSCGDDFGFCANIISDIKINYDEINNNSDGEVLSHTK